MLFDPFLEKEEHCWQIDTLEKRVNGKLDAGEINTCKRGLFRVRDTGFPIFGRRVF